MPTLCVCLLSCRHRHRVCVCTETKSKANANAKAKKQPTVIQMDDLSSSDGEEVEVIEMSMSDADMLAPLGTSDGGLFVCLYFFISVSVVVQYRLVW